MSACYTVNFFQAGYPLHDLDQARPVQVIEAIFSTLVGNFNGVAFLHDDTGNTVCDPDNLIHPQSSLVTAFALFTTNGAINSKAAGDIFFRETHLKQ